MYSYIVIYIHTVRHIAYIKYYTFFSLLVYLQIMAQKMAINFAVSVLCTVHKTI